MSEGQEPAWTELVRDAGGQRRGFTYERDHQPVGRVVAVLTGGNLVVEARRTINMNNEKQTIFLPEWCAGRYRAEQYVASDSVGDLNWRSRQRRDLGRVRQPNRVIRTILHLLDF